MTEAIAAAKERMHLLKGGRLFVVLFPFFPFLATAWKLSGFWSGHGDRQSDRNFARAANNPSKFFSCNFNRVSDKLGDTIGPEARVIIGWVFLREQKRLICFAFLVNIAEVASGKYATLPFTAESYPSTVA